MTSDAEDLGIRLAAFRHLSGLKARHGDTIRREVLDSGFDHAGQHVRLLGPQGIFKPAQLDLPLSVTTAPLSRRKPRPYADSMRPDGFLDYCYRGEDPGHRENAGLRELMRSRRPLVYFHGTISPRYVPVFPVFVVADHPELHTFRMQVAAADLSAIRVATAREVSGANDPELRYRTVQVEQRLHQAMFRDRVLDAYGGRCSICLLRHDELLDAAHIKPDAEGGAPVVSNGLALCKLHHAAFDSDILGIRPDLVVEIDPRVLEEIDGPMLHHGLQGMHDRPLHVPRRAEWRPDGTLVAWRYDRFRSAQ